MYVKKVIFFVYCLSLTSCQDWCEVIAPNKTFKGLGIYHEYNQSGYGQYWFHNEQGLKWKVNLDFNNTGFVKIVMDYNSTQRERQDIQRFSIFYERQNDNYCYINCLSYVDNQVYCNHFIIRQTFFRFYTTVDQNPLGHSFLYMKPFPSKKHDNWLLAINKTDRFDRWTVRFDPLKVEYQPCDDNCTSIPMIDQMNGSLFATLNSIVEFEFELNDTNGQILLFDINHLPYFCLQPENQSLSEQVLLILIHQRCARVGNQQIFPLSAEPGSNQPVRKARREIFRFLHD